MGEGKAVVADALESEAFVGGEDNHDFTGWHGCPIGASQSGHVQ